MIAGPGRVRVGDLGRDAASCAAVSEPGVMAKPEAIYLSLVCVRGSPLGFWGLAIG